MTSKADIVTPIELREILSYLPHRYPFMLLDRVIEYDAERQTLTAIKNVTFNEPYFTGHFPDQPIMPGVLIIEALAQATGVLGFLYYAAKPEHNTRYLLVGVDNVRFRRQVIPGDQLQLHAALVTHKRGIWKFAGEATVGDEVVCKADITSAEQVV